MDFILNTMSKKVLVVDAFGNPLRHIAVIPGSPLGDLAGLQKPDKFDEDVNWSKRGFVVKPKTVILGRNEPCHCKSGNKYKHCCLNKDENARFVLKDAK